MVPPALQKNEMRSRDRKHPLTPMEKCPPSGGRGLQWPPAANRLAKESKEKVK